VSDTPVTPFDPEAFKKRVAATVKGVMLDMMPEEAFEGMIKAEFDAFFQTETWVKVEEFREMTANPAHRPGYGGYGNEPKIEVRYPGLSMKMTPFRQIVWSILNQLLTERVNLVLKSMADKEDTEYGLWVKEQMSTVTQASYSHKFNALVLAMAAAQTQNLFMAARNQAQADTVRLLEVNGMQLQTKPPIY
jgi:hypothetical protein